MVWNRWCGGNSWKRSCPVADSQKFVSKNSLEYFHNFSGSGGLLRRTRHSSSVDKPLLYSEDQYEHKFALAIDYLWIHTTVATTFNLSCITLERSIAIFHPLRYQDILTEKRCFAAIAAIWFMSVTLPFSRFFINGNSSAIMALWMAFTVITVLVPMIIIALSSVRILRAAAHQSKRVVPSSSLAKQEEIRRNKKNYKAAKTVSIVVGLFVVSWLPSLVTSFVNYFTQPGYCGLLYYYNTVWLWVEAVAFASSGINPWVYCLRNRLYYQALNRSFLSRLNRGSSINSRQIYLNS